MSDFKLFEPPKDEPQPSRQCADEPVFRHVLACVDKSPFSHATMAHASAVASAMNARLTVLRVLEPLADSLTPTDPVEWTLRHRDAEVELRDHASQFGDLDTDIVVTDGPAAECICDWVREHGIDLTVLGSGSGCKGPFDGLGDTARRVVKSTKSSVLLVPPTEIDGDPIRYRQIMTPLDGSSQAESALPIAVSIAIAHAAEILLVHAAPNIDLTETGPLESEALALRDRLHNRNERVGEQYLRKVQSWLALAGISTRTRVIASSDPRHALMHAAEDHADIIIFSATGLSGHPNVPVGSVANYLINHAENPILLVRGHERVPIPTHRNAEDAQALELPRRALP